MRFIHCSDIHLDSKMESNLPPDKARQRRQELLDRFEAMADYARHEGVAAVLQCPQTHLPPVPGDHRVVDLPALPRPRPAENRTNPRRDREFVQFWRCHSWTNPPRGRFPGKSP